jgi:hypothetical protein
MIQSKIEKQVWRQVEAKVCDRIRDRFQDYTWARTRRKVNHELQSFEFRGKDNDNQNEIQFWNRFGRDMNRGICAHIRADMESLL